MGKWKINRTSARAAANRLGRLRRDGIKFSGAWRIGDVDPTKFGRRSFDHRWTRTKFCAKFTHSLCTWAGWALWASWQTGSRSRKFFQTALVCALTRHQPLLGTWRRNTQNQNLDRKLERVHHEWRLQNQNLDRNLERVHHERHLRNLTPRAMRSNLCGHPQGRDRNDPHPRHKPRRLRTPRRQRKRPFVRPRNNAFSLKFHASRRTSRPPSWRRKPQRVHLEGNLERMHHRGGYLRDLRPEGNRERGHHRGGYLCNLMTRPCAPASHKQQTTQHNHQ